MNQAAFDIGEACFYILLSLCQDQRRMSFKLGFPHSAFKSYIGRTFYRLSVGRLGCNFGVVVIY